MQCYSCYSHIVMMAIHEKQTLLFQKETVKYTLCPSYIISKFYAYYSH